MELSTYLNFNGRCAEAFKVYERLLGGRIVMMQTHGESPMKDHVPADWQRQGAPCAAGARSAGIDGIRRTARPLLRAAGHLRLPQPPRTWRRRSGYSDGLAEGGRVEMPFEKTFWAAGFGMLVDRFGVPWMVNCEQPS